MCLGAGAYKVVGAKQCSSMRKEVSMATLLMVPTQTFSSCFKSNNQSEMGPPIPTRLQEPCRTNQKHTYPRNAAESKRDTINCLPQQHAPAKGSTQFWWNVHAQLQRKKRTYTNANKTWCQASWLEMPVRTSEGVWIIKMAVQCPRASIRWS